MNPEENKSVTLVAVAPWADCRADYSVRYDGTWFHFGKGESIISMMNMGPLRKLSGKYYSVLYDSNSMPYANTHERPAEYFFEFCSRSPYHGFCYYDLIRPTQLEALEDVLLEIQPSEVVCRIHPQPELEKLLYRLGIRAVWK